WPLRRTRHSQTKLDLVCLRVSYAVNLPPLRTSATLYGASLRAIGDPADSVRNDRLKNVARFLASAVVDVIDPLAPEEQCGKRTGTQLTILQQTPRADLVDARNRLGAENVLVFDPRLQQGSKAVQVC